MATKKQTALEEVKTYVEPDAKKYPGAVGPVDEDRISEFLTIFDKYKAGKAVLERTLQDNEKWYRLRHWDAQQQEAAAQKGKKAKRKEVEPASAWLFNSLANKHADLMDNFPMPNVKPRDQDDQEDAEMLTEILPVVLERNDYEEKYDENGWQKLKHGAAVYGCFWNQSLENGLGDIDIQIINGMNIFWEPGIRDIQKSSMTFVLDLVNNDSLVKQWDFLAGRLGGDTGQITKYLTDDNIDTTDKSVVFDAYYHGRNKDKKEILHYAKFVNGICLFSTENDPEYKEIGWYKHNLYPFVIDKLYPMEGSPFGFGYISLMRDVQAHIDKLNQAILVNAMLCSKTRYFVADKCEVNEEDFADFDKDIVHSSGTRALNDQIMEIKVSPLPTFIKDYLLHKIDELKETSGNRDFSQGGTSSGVTAASAIAALQEAGSKLSRDMVKGSYRAHCRLDYMALELIREFYDQPRWFRLQKGDEEKFVKYDNQKLQEQPIGKDPVTNEDLFRKPIFDIKISAQRQSPFNRISNNELAKELFGLGVFNPMMADQALAMVEMMDFEGKQAVITKIREGQKTMEMIQALQNNLAALAGEADAATGSQLLPSMVQQGLLPETAMPQQMPGQGSGQAPAQAQPQGSGQAPAPKQIGHAAGQTPATLGQKQGVKTASKGLPAGK